MELHEVHSSRKRLHVEEKLSGRAKYGADLRFTDAVYLCGVCPDTPHGRIEKIDAAECLLTHGVLGVFTAEDLAGKNGFGLFCDDEPIFAAEEVRFCGDVVAVVAAETSEAARNGARRVRVDVTPLPAVLTAEDAFAAETVVNPDYPDNICADEQLSRGDAEKALAALKYVVDETYETSLVEHAYLEPEVMAAVPIADGRLEIRGAMQHPFYMRQVVCDALAIPQDMVTVHADALGGSFGGKVEISAAMAARAALVALRLHRPAVYVLTREESICQSHKRHGIMFGIRLGADENGCFGALKVDAVMDGGAYVNESPIVSWKTVTCGSGPYRIPNVSYENRAYMSNNSVCGAMRGFGTPQAIFALESAVNELAQKMNISPLELRRRNLLRQGDTAPNGQALTTHAVSISAVMEKAAADLGFERKFERYSHPQTGRFRRGVGIACSIRGVSFGADSEDTGRARLRLCADGIVELFCPMMDMGQGADTVLTQICADALSLPLERVRRANPSTEGNPDTGAAGASRGTFIGGNAILRAAELLKDAAAEVLGASHVRFETGCIRADEKKYTFGEVCRAFAACGRQADVTASYTVKEMPWNKEKCQGDAFISYTYSCHAAEVEVDTETGKTRILCMTACHDAGRIINPQMATGQVSGGLVMGVGMALTEKVAANPRTGAVRARNFDSYLLPTAMDVGQMKISFVENPDDEGPFGCKSLGEPAMEPAPAAILGAVNQALGDAGAVRRMPADLETVFFAAHPELRGDAK